MSSKRPKQDRQGVRTATDIERKYNLGNAVTASYVQATVRSAVATATNDFKGYVEEFNKDVVEQGDEIATLKEAEIEIREGLSVLQQADLEIKESLTQIQVAASATDKSVAENRTSISQANNSIAGIEQSIDGIENAMATTNAATNKSISDLRKDLESTTGTANRAAENVDGVINDVYDRMAFVEGGTTFKGSIVPLVLPQGTDLDGVLHLNKYVGGDVAENEYLNCPIQSGTFSLEVESVGNEGQLLQRLTYSHKTEGKTLERIFDLDEWGEWVLVTDYTTAVLDAINDDVIVLEQAFNKHKSEADAKFTALTNSTQTMNGTLQSVSSDLQGVITDINDHFEFNEGGMTIRGGINPLLLPARTDLDGLMIPNKYVGGTVTDYNYVNCPIASGTFLLDVEICGDQEQLKQTLSYCNKTKGRTYERYFYGDSWGEWFSVADFEPIIPETSKLLWNEGVYYMTATQTVNLPEAVSAQKNGIILVFSEYKDGAASDSAFHCFFVPKIQVATQPGKDYVFTLATSKFAHLATKCVYIHDTKIVGHADNNQTGTGDSGVKFTNNRFVLRYVFGV